MKWIDIYEKAGRVIDRFLLHFDFIEGEEEKEKEWLNKMQHANYWQIKFEELGKYNPDRAFQHLKRHISRKKWKKRGKLTVAACLVLGLGLGIWQQQKEVGKKVYQVVQGAKEKNGKKPVVLTLHDGTQMTLGKESKILEQPTAGVKIDSGAIAYHSSETLEKEKPVYNSLEVPKGGEYRLILADGTTVWLNADSHLKYPVAFYGAQRKVELSGEAYFDVVGNPEKPFVVSTSRGEIRVYGTQFNVKQYPDENSVEVTLVEGKVNFALSDLTPVELSPGHQLVSDGKNIEIRPVYVRNYTSWKDNLLCFDNESLEKVMKILERWYDVEVTFQSPALKELRFSGNLNKYSDIQSFFCLFEASIPVKFSMEDNKVIIREVNK